MGWGLIFVLVVTSAPVDMQIVFPVKIPACLADLLRTTVAPVGYIAWNFRSAFDAFVESFSSGDTHLATPNVLTTDKPQRHLAAGAIIEPVDRDGVDGLRLGGGHFFT